MCKNIFYTLYVLCSIFLGAQSCSPILLNLNTNPTAGPKPAPILPLNMAYLAQGSVSSHNCGIGTNGITYCWGKNNQGQLGDGTTKNSYLASPIFLTQTSQIAVGYDHTCAIANSFVYCWGSNAFGQLGFVSAGNMVFIPSILSITGVTNLQTGGMHSCAYISQSTSLYCWGNNTNGMLGANTNANIITTPAFITKNTVTQMSMGMNHSCFIDGNTNVYCWGDNTYGQVTNSVLNTVTKPTFVMQGAQSVQLGEYYTCVLTTQGSIYCWGNNTNGQLANGTTNSSSVPSIANFLTTLSSIAAGSSTLCGMNAYGIMYCAGNNSEGQTGIGSNTPNNILIPNQQVVTATSSIPLANQPTALYGHSGFFCALITANTPGFCWGANYNGRLGTNKFFDYSTSLYAIMF
jgi:alpha-tubulin suppressor-like RCC1 family protein